jgi:cytoskeleton protein RodZ
MRGISLDEIATATKISTRNLLALEEEKFKMLPGGIFNKGFVRAYAKFLGIDEDQAVAEYVTAAQDNESSRDQKLRNDLSKVDFRHDEEQQREISLEPKSQWGTIAVIVLIAVIGFSGFEYYQKEKAERRRAEAAASVVTAPVAQQVQTPAPMVPTTAAPTTPDPSGTTNQAQALTGTPTGTAAVTFNDTARPANDTARPANDTAKPAAQKSTDTTPADSTATAAPIKESDVPPSANGPIDVKIHANQDSWVSITADGKTIMKGTLSAASEKAVRAKEQVVVVLGNVGGVEVSFNGKPLELGKGTEVKKITFTPTGYE